MPSIPSIRHRRARSSPPGRAGTRRRRRRCVNHAAIQPEEFARARSSLRISKNGQPVECADERRVDHHRPRQIGNPAVQSAIVDNNERGRVENRDAAGGRDFIHHKVEESHDEHRHHHAD
jgi:hypothetical protein